MSETRVPPAGIRSAVACPRRYELEHALALEAGDPPRGERRLALCRDAIRAGLAAGPAETAMREAAQGHLEAAWADHEEPFHSPSQREHAHRVLASAVTTFLVDHGRRLAAGREPLAGPVADGDLEVTVELSGDARCTLSLPVDVCAVSEGDLLGVRFCRYRSRLGRCRYGDDWDGPVAERFRAHVDPRTDDHDVHTAATLLETSAVLRGLRATEAADDRLCRYVVVPLLDPDVIDVNWVDGAVETSVEPVDLTQPYLDHPTFARTHEHRNDEVDRRLRTLLERLAEGRFDPADRWSVIETHECPRCPFRVCCQDALAAEVRFDA